MNFAGDNPAINSLLAVDSDLLVENYMSKSILPGVHTSTDTSLLDDLNISVQAGLYGMANNALNIGNYLGGDFETYDVATELGDLGGAYLESKDSYNLAGDIITSLIPGTLAFKALNAVKLAKRGDIISKSLGFFDNRSERALQEAAGILRNAPNFNKVKLLKAKAFGYSTLDEMGTGIVVGAAIESSQHLGSILMNESMDFGDKLAAFAQPVFAGAVIGAPFGAFNYFAKTRAILKPALDARNGVLGDMAYATVNTKGNTILDKEHVSNHILGELDRINKYSPKDTENATMVQFARDEFSQQAEGEYQRYITEISAKSSLGKAHSPEEKAVIKNLQGIVDANIGTEEGRRLLKNLFDKTTKADHHPYHASETIYNKTKAVAYRDISVIYDNPTTSGALGIKFAGQDFKMIPLTSDIKVGTRTLADENRPLSAMALNTDHPNVLDNLDKYKLLNRLIGATNQSTKALKQETSIVSQLGNTGEFLKANGIDVLDEADVFGKLSAVKTVIESGSFKVSPKLTQGDFVKTMEGLFATMKENKATEYLLTDQGNKWIDLATSNIKNKPVPTLFGKNLAAIDKPTTINPKTSLLGVQKLRLQAGKNATKKDAGYYNKLNESVGTPEETLQAWTQLEALTIKSIEDGATSVKLAGETSMSFRQAYTLVRRFKRQSAETLLKNNDADNVMHTLGITDLPTLLSHAEVPALVDATQVNKIMKNGNDLTKMKEIRLTIKTKTLNPAEVLLRSADDSARLDQIARGKAVASEAAGEDLGKVLPDMPDLGYVEEIGAERLINDSHLKGDIGGVNATSVYIGDQKLALTDRLIARARAETKIDGVMNAMIESPKSAGEASAFLHWYRTKGNKFGMVENSDGTVIMVERKTLDKYEALKQDRVDVPESIPTLKEWLKSPEIAGLKVETYEVTDSLAAQYVKAIQVIDRKHVNYGKNLIDGAFDNTINAPENLLYMPPRNLAFSRYFRVKSTDPTSQTSSTLHKVSSSSKQGIADQVQKAKEYFNEKGIKAQLISGDDAATQKALKLEFNWDGLELNLGKSVSGVARQGAHPDVALSTIQEIIADTNDWLESSLSNVARGSIELHYMDELSKMRSLASLENKYKFNGNDTLVGQAIDQRNIGTWDTIHKQMIGQDAPYSIYNHVNNWVADTSVTLLQPFHEARLLLRDALSKTGQITRKEITEADAFGKQALKDRGLDDTIGNAIDGYLSKETTLTGKNIQEAVAGTQYIMSTLLLRLDGIDPVMNILGMTTKLSSEMKYIQEVVKNSPIERSKVDDVYVQWFGAGKFQSGEGIDLNLLSPFKAVGGGMKDMFDGKAKTFLAELEELGIYKNDIKVMSELIDDLPIPQDISDAASEARFLGKTRDNVKKATEWLTTPHKASITLTQYTALKFASDIADAAGVDLATKRMLMSGMNHRVNAISSHVSKPRLFQGLVGNAVSLYQSYFMHTIGNMTRHAKSVGSGPVTRSVMMNASIFGMQTTPGFDFINKQVAGQQDANNADLYSTAYDILPPDVADTIMFGVGSTLLRANLTSRGDLTPRYATVFPTSVEQLAITTGIVNTVGSIVDNTYKLVTGEQGISQTVMNTITDSKLSRPLNGLVSVLNGKTVDNRHNLVSLHDDLSGWGNAVRLLGAKPLDEARTNQAFWNLQAYRTRDEQRKANLGNIMKQEFQNNPEVMDDPEWINNKYNKYVNAGGNARNFQRFYTSTVLKADTTFEQRLQRSIKDIDVARNYKHVLGVD